MSAVLMLVSAHANDRLREAVREGRLPCPEYLRLEERYDIELLDWSRLGARASERSTGLSLSHAWAALELLGARDAVFSDGEHVGVPLALAMLVKGVDTPHLMLGHHLTTRVKQPVFRLLKPQRRISRVLVHSNRQLDMAVSELAIPRQRLAFVAYGVDTDFWSPASIHEERLVVSAGREHRDYATLARACGDVPIRVFVAAGSLFSPAARQHQPREWPSNFQVGFAEPAVVREMYARASVVVVPLVPNDFQAGVTVVLEAMAMAKTVVVTATEGHADVLEDGVTGLMVPPGDATALRDAVVRLLTNPSERRRLGANARQMVEARFGLDQYVDRLAWHLEQICHPAIGIGGATSRLSRPDRDDHPMTMRGGRP
jgi:glycosyltransferase involved in cell wall biosynthesis